MTAAPDTTPDAGRIVHDPELRAAYLLGMEHGHTDGHAAGYAECWHQYADSYLEKLAELDRDVCAHTHPAITQAVAGLFGTWDGADMAHARSVENFRRDAMPTAESSPRCDCGDWARGYHYRDTMTPREVAA